MAAKLHLSLRGVWALVSFTLAPAFVKGYFEGCYTGHYRVQEFRCEALVLRVWGFGFSLQVSASRVQLRQKQLEDSVFHSSRHACTLIRGSGFTV